MMDAYIEYLKNLNNSLIRAGVRLPLNLSSNYSDLFHSVSILEEYVYFNRVLDICDSGYKIPTLATSSKVFYSDIIKDEIYAEYIAGLEDAGALLFTEPTDELKVDKEVKDFITYAKIDNEVYSDSADDSYQPSATEMFMSFINKGSGSSSLVQDDSPQDTLEDEEYFITEINDFAKDNSYSFEEDDDEDEDDTDTEEDLNPYGDDAEKESSQEETEEDDEDEDEDYDAYSEDSSEDDEDDEEDDDDEVDVYSDDEENDSSSSGATYAIADVNNLNESAYSYEDGDDAYSFEEEDYDSADSDDDDDYDTYSSDSDDDDSETSEDSEDDDEEDVYDISSDDESEDESEDDEDDDYVDAYADDEDSEDSSEDDDEDDDEVDAYADDEDSSEDDDEDDDDDEVDAYADDDSADSEDDDEDDDEVDAYADDDKLEDSSSEDEDDDEDDYTDFDDYSEDYKEPPFEGDTSQGSKNAFNSSKGLNNSPNMGYSTKSSDEIMADQLVSLSNKLTKGAGKLFSGGLKKVKERMDFNHEDDMNNSNR